MKIRFVQVILDNGTVEVLCTNITDNERLKTSEFKELYALRWGIETYFDLIKNRLSLENFTGQSALAVKQDFFATIFLTNKDIHKSTIATNSINHLKRKKKNVGN